MRILVQLPALLCFGLLLSGAQAASYKWVDEQGTVQYSQNPPMGTEVIEVIKPPPPPAGQQDDGDDDLAENSESTTEPEDDTAKAEFEKILKQNCETARKNMKVYKVSRQIRTLEGKVINLDYNTRIKKIKESQADIDKYCKNQQL